MTQTPPKNGKVPKSPSIAFERHTIEDQLEFYERTHRNLDLGDNWEDKLRIEFQKREKLQYLPVLEELIDLNLVKENLPITQALINAKSNEEIESILKEGIQWAKK